MSQDFRTYRIDDKTIEQIIGLAPSIPKDVQIRGVLCSAATAPVGGCIRIFGRVMVDFRSDYRPGTWIQTSTVKKTTALKHPNPNWWLVETKNSYYLVQMQEGNHIDVVQ